MSAELIPTVVDGERTALVAATVPDDAPAAVREGLARRRLTVTTGACPCGAVLRLPSRRERRAAARTGRALHVTVVHAEDCPATTENLEKVMRGAS